MSNINDVRVRAMNLLAMREHSYAELTDKLVQKGFDKIQVDDVVWRLREENLQSDERYTEAYVRARAARGFGPIKIRLELSARGVSDAIVRTHFASLPESFWQSAIQTAWHKKYRGQFDGSINEKAKSVRYLQYKGFAHDDIYNMINEEVFHEQ